MLKKLFKNAKFQIVGSITILGGAVILWWNVYKTPGKSLEVIGGVNADTAIHIHADSLKDSLK